jgi:hypothetical protein
MRCAATLGTSIALAVAAWLSGADASAQSPKAEAKQHFDAGNALVDNEDYAAATAEFELSVRIYPTKMGLFNLANCYKALNRYGAALEALARLEREFTGKLGGLAGEVAVLKNTIEGMVGRLDVKVDRDGAAVLVDGAEIGTSPLAAPLVLAPGDHAIEARLEGYTDAAQTVRIAAREKAEASLVLEVKPPPAVEPPPPAPVEIAPAAPEAKPPAAPAVELAPPPPAAPPPSPEELKAERLRHVLRALGWTSFQIGVVAGVVSVALYGVASSKADEFADAKSDYDAAVQDLEIHGQTAAIAADASRAWKRLEDSRDVAVTSQKVGLGFGISAGVLVAAATTLFVLSRDKEEKAGAKPAVAAAPGGLAVEF